MNQSLIDSLALLTDKVQNDPGAIIGPISQFLGYILNAIFSFVSLLTERHSLGISIIIFTFIVRALMVPFAVKSQKSMSKMQQLQPEIEKIKAKYGNSKDPELQRKMNAEIQALYSKSGVNPLGGCLPLLIQFPIFIALSYCMQQSFMFITKLGAVYKDMVECVSHWFTDAQLFFDRVTPLVQTKLNTNQSLEIGWETEEAIKGLMKVFNKFREADWNSFFTLFADMPQNLNEFQLLLTHKENIEYFFGINMLENPGFVFPAILIPILSGVTSFLTSWQSSKQNTSTDQNSKMSQQVMMFAMPLMMLYFTFTMPTGVGLYWTVSSVFQILQQQFLFKRYKPQAVVKEKKEIITLKPDKTPRGSKRK